MNLRRSGRKLGHGEINCFDQSLLNKDPRQCVTVSPNTKLPAVQNYVPNLVDIWIHIIQRISLVDIWFQCKGYGINIRQMNITFTTFLSF